MKKLNIKNSSYIKVISIITVLFVVIATNIQPIEKSLVYNPCKAIQPFIEEVSDRAEIQSFKNSENQDIYYLHINKNDEQKDLPVIVYCHGNTNNSTFYQFRVKFLAQKGYEIFMPDYRGFGKSSGNLSERGFYKDLNEFINILESEYKIDKNRIIIWGHSLGGAIVADNTALNSYKGVILESTFTSITGMKIFTMNCKENPLEKFFYWIIPVSQKFETDKKIQKIKSPLLIISSKKDEMVPYQMGEKLSNLNPSAKFFLSEKGGHDEIGWQEEAIVEFINSLK